MSRIHAAPLRRRLPIGPRLAGAFTVAAATLGASVLPASAQEPVVVPAPIVRTLDNGLEVRVIEARSLPVVHFRLLVRAGSRHESEDQAGLARLTAESVHQGLQEGAEDGPLASLGGQFAVRADRDFTMASGAAPARTWRAALAEFARRLRDPEFGPSRFESIRSQALASLSQWRRDPAAVALDHARALLHGGHPYARPAAGSEASLLSATPADARAFHETWWRPGNAALAIAGDVDPEAAFAAAQEAFGGWPAAETPSVPTLRAPDLEATRIRLLDRPGAPTTEIRIAWPGLSRDHPDFLAADLLLHILGAPGLPNRLVRAVEETIDRELPIGADASFGTDTGSFVIHATVPNENVRSTIEAIRGAVETFREGGWDDDERKEARRHFLGTYRFGFRTPAAAMEQDLLATHYGLSEDALAGFPDSLAALEEEALVRVAAERFRVDPVVLVAVGPAEEIGFQVERFGTVETLPMGAPTGALPEIAIPEPAPTAPATEESRARGTELMAAALEAHGGRAALESIEGWKASGTVEMTFTNPPATGQYAEVFQSPNRRRVEMSLLGQTAVQVVDGERGWGMRGGQVFELPDEEVESLRASGFSHPLRLLQTLAEPGNDLRYVGEEMLAGRPVEIVEWVRNENDFARLFLDQKSHLLAQLEQQEVAPLGAGYVVFQREYRDYRTVEGLEVPHRIVVFANGNKAMEQNFSEVLVNEGFSEETFRRPIQ